MYNKTCSTVLLSVLMLLTACGAGEQRTKQDLGFVPVLADTTVRLSADSLSPTCSISLELQMATKGKAAKAMNDALLRDGLLMPDYYAPDEARPEMNIAVDSFVKRYIDDYLNAYGQFYRQNRLNAQYYNCRYSVKAHVEEGNDSTIAYVAETAYYGGGMYETRQTRAWNFDVRTGQLLRLDELFAHGYERRLTQLVTDRLCDRFDADGADGLADKRIFADRQVYLPENFIVGEKGITFIYCTDEIAPHDVGEIRIDIPYRDMGTLLLRH